MADALDDGRVAQRMRDPLPSGVLVRLQRIAAAKSPEGNYVLELGEDGSARVARHSGTVTDWKTPMDTELPPAPNAKARFGSMRKIRKLVEDVSATATATPQVVTGEPAKDGVFEILTVAPDHQVVYDGEDTELLRALRKIAGEG